MVPMCVWRGGGRLYMAPKVCVWGGRGGPALHGPQGVCWGVGGGGSSTWYRTTGGGGRPAVCNPCVKTRHEAGWFRVHTHLWHGPHARDLRHQRTYSSTAGRCEVQLLKLDACRHQCLLGTLAVWACWCGEDNPLCRAEILPHASGSGRVRPPPRPSWRGVTHGLDSRLCCCAA